MSSPVEDALCAACRDIFSGCVTHRYRPFDLPVQIRHHEIPGNFLEAARKGCDFCSSLMKEVEKCRKYKEGLVKLDDLVTDYVLYFTKDPPLQLQRLQFWVLSPSMDLNSVLQFEFYLDANEPSTNSIDICICDERAGTTLSTLDQIPEQPRCKLAGGPLRERLSRRERISSWVDQCTLNHRNCNTGVFGSGFLPTRVIDVGERGDTAWCILHSGGTSRRSSKYVTLSHRWKPQNTKVRLLSSNETAMHQGYPDTELSSNFRTAMEMARDLGVRYLWIDCLCIIQDSRDDWETESQKMCEVYANSYLNFAAADVAISDNNDYAAKINYFPLYVFPVRLLWCGHSREYTSTSKHKDWWQTSIESLPILRRGWIFQERFLSPRMLYFDHYELFWQCREMKASESAPAGVLDHMYPGTLLKSLYYLYSSQSSESHQLDSSNGLHSNCRNAVTTYSSCQLTKFSDRLSAVGGIAKLFQTSMGNIEYLAGSWRTDIERGLSWWPEKAQDSFDGSEGLLFPTWSWASHNGPVSWRSLSKTETVTSMVQLHDAVPTDFHGKRGQNSKTSDNPITLRGIIQPLSIGAKARMKINGQILKPFGFEFDRHRQFDSLEAFCLPLWVIVRDYPDVEVRHLECLVISRLDEHHDNESFKRIGIVCFKMKSAKRINDVFDLLIESPMERLTNQWKLIRIV